MADHRESFDRWADEAGASPATRVALLHDAVASVAAERDECRAALEELVRLKDGPRDDAYLAAKDAAWKAARDALASRGADQN